jgi:hypothetical protein
VINGYNGEERRQHAYRLPDFIFNAIVEAAAQRGKELAKKELYAEIGEGVFRRLLWLFGAGGTAAVIFVAPDSLKHWIKSFFQ